MILRSTYWLQSVNEKTLRVLEANIGGVRWYDLIQTIVSIPQGVICLHSALAIYNLLKLCRENIGLVLLTVNQ